MNALGQQLTPGLLMKQTLALSLLLASRLLGQESKPQDLLLPDETETPRLKAWISHRYGMFIHYGMNTFVGTQQVPKPPPVATFAPPAIDVDAWIKLAKDAGMKYAVLTNQSGKTAATCSSTWDPRATVSFPGPIGTRCCNSKKRSRCTKSLPRQRQSKSQT